MATMTTHRLSKVVFIFVFFATLLVIFFNNSLHRTKIDLTTKMTEITNTSMKKNEGTSHFVRPSDKVTGTTIDIPRPSDIVTGTKNDIMKPSTKVTRKADNIVSQSNTVTRTPHDIIGPTDDDLPSSDNITRARPSDYSNVTKLIYNRVPKCGSLTMLQIIEMMAKRNKFNFVHNERYHHRLISDEAQKSMVDLIISLDGPLIYDRHTQFVDFNRFGQPQPYYINIVREPVSRLGSDISMRYKHIANISDIFLSEEYQSNVEYYFVIVPYFCGQHRFCMKPSEQSLSVAKRNVEKYYILVGITEDYKTFLRGLERLLPQFYAGVTDLPAVSGIHKHNRSYEPLTPLCNEMAKKMLKEEIEFYYFVKRLFYHKTAFLLDNEL